MSAPNPRLPRNRFPVKTQNTQKNKPTPPPIRGTKDKNSQSMRPTEAAPWIGSLPPAANRKMEQLFAFLEKERTASVQPSWRRWLHAMPFWIWPSFVGGVLAGIVAWTLLAPPKRPLQAITSQDDSRPGIKQAGPSRATASNAHGETQPSFALPLPSIPGPTGDIKAAGSATAAIRAEIQKPLNTSEPISAPKNVIAPKSLSEITGMAFFNGVDLAGWEATNGCWRVEDGLLVGSLSATEKVLAVLRSKQTYKDFDLRFRVRLKGATSNCALRFRAKTDGPGAVSHTGAQCVIRQGAEGKTYAIGSLIDCSTDTHEVAEASGKAAAFAKLGDFNQVQVRCEGEAVVVRVNGIMAACKKLASMPREGVIVFELDGRQQPGEVTFKDFKFTDLMRSGAAQNTVRSAAESDAILKAEADYRQSRELATRKLLSSFDSQIKQRLSPSSQPAGKHSGTVAMLEQEKDAFLRKGHIPWSRQMRSAAHDYLTELEQAQQRMEQLLGSQSAAVMQRGDQKAIAELEAVGNKILSPHLIATARFAGTRMRFRSDGILEKSDDDAPRRWWISADKHDDVIVELPNDSDTDNATQEVFRIGENGKSLTESTVAGKHEWVFVDK
jgi:hypothetical protein